jgi:hypothetical protein
MPLPEVAAESERVVHATVVEVAPGHDASGVPATWVTLHVERAFKGGSGAWLTIKQFGTTEPLADGSLGRIAGLPRFTVGEEVVLFLRGDSRHGFTSPVGLGQGVYRVSGAPGNRKVRSDLPDDPGKKQPLDEFLQQVERLTGAAR